MLNHFVKMNSVGTLHLIYSEAVYVSSSSKQKHFDKNPFFHLETLKNLNSVKNCFLCQLVHLIGIKN